MLLPMQFSFSFLLIAFAVVIAFVGVLWFCDGKTFTHRRDTLMMSLTAIFVAVILLSLPELWAAIAGKVEPTVLHPEPCNYCIWIMCWGC